MKRLAFILFASFLSGNILTGQTVETILGSATDYMFRPASVRELPLFNAAEIKERNIRRCTVIEYSYNYNTATANPDTLHVYEFDKIGSLLSDIRFRNLPNQKDTFYYQHSASVYYKKIDSSISLAAGRKTVEQYYIWDFNWQKPEEIDTGVIVRKVYDENNRLIELKSNGTPDYHQINFCGTGITYHYKYGYDAQNRVVLYDDLGYRYYALFRYTPRGIAVSVHNKEYEEKPRKYFVSVKKTGSGISEDDNEVTITLKPLSPGSALFCELSEHRGGKKREPTVYKFIYEYNTTPSPDRPVNSIVSN